MPRTKNTEGMYPNAHPTAPGGMSRKSLIKELTDTHGYEAEGWDEVSWPDIIDLVCQERLAREAEVSVRASRDQQADLDALAEFERVAEIWSDSRRANKATSNPESGRPSRPSACSPRA